MWCLNNPAVLFGQDSQACWRRATDPIIVLLSSLHLISRWSCQIIHICIVKSFPTPTFIPLRKPTLTSVSVSLKNKSKKEEKKMLAFKEKSWEAGCQGLKAKHILKAKFSSFCNLFHYASDISGSVWDSGSASAMTSSSWLAEPPPPCVPGSPNYNVKSLADRRHSSRPLPTQTFLLSHDSSTETALCFSFMFSTPQPILFWLDY